jgi:hypothetical protein
VNQGRESEKGKQAAKNEQAGKKLINFFLININDFSRATLIFFYVDTI